MTMARSESRATVFYALATSRDPHPVLRKRGATRPHAPGRLRGGGGAAHKHPRPLPPSGQARAQAAQPRRRVKTQCLWAPQRAATPAVAQDSARWPGAAQRAPVRRLARRRPALRAGATAPDRQRGCAATYQRRPTPASAPRGSRPGPGQVCARRGPETVGPQDGCGAPGAPRRSRPTGGTRGPSSCRRSPTACRRRPWRLCPNGTRRRHPAPVGRAPGHGWPPRARDCGACQGPERSGAKTGAWPQGAWPS
jgi:hypothetical protein